MFLLGVTVTIVRHPGFDAYGDPVAGETRTTLHGVTLAPRVGGPGTASSDIEGRGREGVRSGITMYAPVGVDIERTDLIEVAVPGFAGIYKVDGVPSTWVSPFDGWEAGTEVALTLAEG